MLYCCCSTLEKKETIVDRAVSYVLSLEDETLGTLTAEDVAAELRAGFPILFLTFRIVQNISLSEFIREVKLQRAYNALEKDCDINILELSKRLGFFTAEDFEQEFEKYYGLNPFSFQNKKEKNRDLDVTPPIKTLKKYFEALRDIV